MTQKILKELISYNQETGIFTWKERNELWFSHCKYPSRACNGWNTKNSGNPAGVVSKNCRTAYIKISLSPNGVAFGRKTYTAHVLAFLYVNGSFSKMDIDHKDGNGLNNSWNNLVEMSHQNNCKKRRIAKNNKSGFNGVCWNDSKGKWVVQICVNGKVIHGGYFTDIGNAIGKRKELNVVYGFHENHGKI